MRSPRQHLGQRGFKGVERGFGQAVSISDYDLMRAKQGFQFLCLNFYAFALSFSTLIAKKKQMHFPKPRFTESEITILMP